MYMVLDDIHTVHTLHTFVSSCFQAADDPSNKLHKRLPPSERWCGAYRRTGDIEDLAVVCQLIGRQAFLAGWAHQQLLQRGIPQACAIHLIPHILL